MAITFPTRTGRAQGIVAMNQARRDQEQAMKRIAAGLRILSAADDAAGVAIAASMNAELRSLGQATQNANDGVSLAQTADGGLSQVSDILGRMRELSMQSANGTLNDEQRQAIDKEYQSLKSEIDRVVDTTEFNGTKPLSGGETVELQVGDDAGETAELTVDDTNTSTLGVDVSDVTSADGARASLDSIDAAMDAVASRRVQIGSFQNRLESTLSNLSRRSIDLTESVSRIEDADIAEEVAALTAASIRTQGSVAMQAQANQASSLSLDLL